MEERAGERADALLHAWRELAREERWWLYSKAAGPGQRPGAGWRRALFHALGETSETRSAPAEEIKKKPLGGRRKLRRGNSSETLLQQARTDNGLTIAVASLIAHEQTKRKRGKGNDRKLAEDNRQTKLF
jgi:hypothetical protein